MFAANESDFGADTDSRQDIEPSGSADEVFRHYPVVCKKERPRCELHNRPGTLLRRRRSSH